MSELSVARYKEARLKSQIKVLKERMAELTQEYQELYDTYEPLMAELRGVQETIIIWMAEENKMIAEMRKKAPAVLQTVDQILEGMTTDQMAILLQQLLERRKK